MYVYNGLVHYWLGLYHDNLTDKKHAPNFKTLLKWFYKLIKLSITYNTMHIFNHLKFETIMYIQIKRLVNFIYFSKDILVIYRVLK